MVFKTLIHIVFKFLKVLPFNFYASPSIVFIPFGFRVVTSLVYFLPAFIKYRARQTMLPKTFSWWAINPLSFLKPCFYSSKNFMPLLKSFLFSMFSTFLGYAYNLFCYL